jgi:hypothetical protein
VRLKQPAVPAQKVFRRRDQLAVAVSDRHVGDAPVRRLAPAVNTQARARSLHDEAVVLQLAKPIGDVVPVSVTQLLAGVALTKVDVAVVLYASHPECCVERSRAEGELQVGRRLQGLAKQWDKWRELVAAAVAPAHADAPLD